MSLVEINGVNYTNKWSNSMPARVNGVYNVHYVGSYAWSHFEAAGIDAVASQNTQLVAVDENSAGMVYPNPAIQRSFSIRLTDQTIKNITVTISDLYGKVLLQKEVKVNEPLKISSSMPAGIYNVSVSTKSRKVMSTKLMIR
jgi:hypothetical protein